MGIALGDFVEADLARHVFQLGTGTPTLHSLGSSQKLEEKTAFTCPAIALSRPKTGDSRVRECQAGGGPF